jgi:hypothetical protein
LGGRTGGHEEINRSIFAALHWEYAKNTGTDFFTDVDNIEKLARSMGFNFSHASSYRLLEQVRDSQVLQVDV